MRLQRFLVLLLFCLPLVSCWDFRARPEPRDYIQGYKPIYSTDASLLTITMEAPRAVQNAGKIYAFGNYVFQNELGAGIHVLDKSNPSQLANVGFINIKGNTELSIKNTHLYANSFNDLVVIDVSDWKQPKELQRLKNAFQKTTGRYQPFIPLPEKNVYFECIDPSKGIHNGWKKDTLSYNNCYSFSN